MIHRLEADATSMASDALALQRLPNNGRDLPL